MATIRPEPQSVTSQPRQSLPRLEPGDHLDQPTFHERYQAMPEGVRAELVEGVVYMPSPAKSDHGGSSWEMNGWLWTYKVATPGLFGADNVTVILGAKNELQPDGCLLVLSEHGGQVKVKDGYLTGSPELVLEVASSSASYDLYTKRLAYEKAGVKEYLVFIVREPRVLWLVRQGESYVELTPGTDGILRSIAFPGLWLDPEGLLRGDSARVLAVLHQGLASPEHAAFVAKLNPKPEP